MTRLICAAAIALAASGGVACAQGMMADPWGDATVARADAEAKAGERFDQLDANHDGVLEESEMPAFGRGRRGGGGRRMMSRADTDGDGKVSKAEFVAMQLARFDREDADHDGKLTKAERDNARAAMMARMGQWGGGSDGSGGGMGAIDGGGVGGD